MTPDFKRPLKGRFEYQKGRFGTTIIYDPPLAKIIGRCPIDGTPLHSRGKGTIFSKDHKWTLQDSTRDILAGKVVGFSPFGGPLLFIDRDFSDKSGNWWKME